jgi:hypothetical protein
VAGIFGNSGVFGASDRMLTAGDVEFEPQQTKIRFLTSSCGAMVAGDAYLQEEILQGVQEDIAVRIAERPNEWIPIRDIARLYRTRCDAACRVKAEAAILVPLGITSETFLTRQHEFAESFVTKLANELYNFEAPRVEVIISGLDESGPHIYVVDNKEIHCEDSVGFAAIGGGYWHANSQLMFFGHTRATSINDALLNIYFAKRRAEVAPGVGEATDMFIVSALGGIGPVGEHVMAGLEDIYEDAQQKQRKIAEESRETTRKFVEQILNSAPQNEQNQPPEDTRGDASAHEAPSLSGPEPEADSN